MAEMANRERPILFSGEMVRAILRGDKTQTRRVVKPSNSEFSSVNTKRYWDHGDFQGRHPGTFVDGQAETGQYLHVRCHEQDENAVSCPVCREWGWSGTSHRLYCRWPVGDRLWARETWSPMQRHRPIANPEVYDNKPAWYLADNDRPMWAEGKWKPSIHMPRWASRLTLEITGIRVERLQEINWLDAIAEGMRDPRRSVLRVSNEHPRSPLVQFRKLWDSINAKRPGCAWADNPWLWVVEFKRVD